MRREQIWHGCLCLVVGASLAPATSHAQPVQVRSRVFEIDYEVSEDALPLASVHLWYTLDDGVTWLESGYDEDRQTPIAFDAPREGLYGFFLVLANTTGPSSSAPKSGTLPHLLAFVDYSPPVVQLHALRPATAVGQRVLQIRWTAIDPHLGPRPVSIFYQLPPSEAWHPATPDPLPNTGRFDWRVPESFSGPVAVKLVVHDQGGHRVESKRQIIELASVEFAGPSNTESADVDAGRLVAHSASLPGSPRSRERARRLFTEALTHRERGEYRAGIARLREAVKLSPQWAEAFAEMADMLYRVGDLESASKAYDLALRQRPRMRAALRGTAMVHRKRNNNAAAGEVLRTILRYNPNDAEVWMNLGDIAIYQGCERTPRRPSAPRASGKIASGPASPASPVHPPASGNRVGAAITPPRAKGTGVPWANTPPF